MLHVSQEVHRYRRGGQTVPLFQFQEQPPVPHPSSGWHQNGELCGTWQSYLGNSCQFLTTPLPPACLHMCEGQGGSDLKGHLHHVLYLLPEDPETESRQGKSLTLGAQLPGGHCASRTAGLKKIIPGLICSSEGLIHTPTMRQMSFCAVPLRGQSENPSLGLQTTRHLL